MTENEKIRNVIDNCKYMRVGFNDDGEVYIVPLNFGFEIENGQYVFYFHGDTGRKTRAMEANPRVGFELDCDYSLKENDKACAFTVKYKSVIGNGVMEVLSNRDDKIRGLSLLMEHHTGRFCWDFDEKEVEAVTVFRLKATKISYRERV